MLPYKIVVPSRKRPHNMPLVRLLLPTATICADEREAEDYASLVPPDRLLLHPPMDGLPRVLNWLQDNIAEPVLIEIDDDFVGVQATTGSKRQITESEEILAILENSIQCCEDLGLTVFCYSRTPNTTIIRPNERPIVPTQSVRNAFGIMGKARHRKWDPDLTGRADVDWTLRTLLEDRCVMADVRYYFDCGRVFAGRGGNVGIVSPEQFKRASLQLKERWGRSVSFNPPAFAKKRDVGPIGIRVSRTNKSAQR
jgi:hypothetical protein